MFVCFGFYYFLSCFLVCVAQTQDSTLEEPAMEFEVNQAFDKNSSTKAPKMKKSKSPVTTKSPKTKAPKTRRYAQWFIWLECFYVVNVVGCWCLFFVGSYSIIDIDV